MAFHRSPFKNNSAGQPFPKEGPEGVQMVREFFSSELRFVPLSPDVLTSKMLKRMANILKRRRPISHSDAVTLIAMMYGLSGARDLRAKTAATDQRIAREKTERAGKVDMARESVAAEAEGGGEVEGVSATVVFRP